ncbi:hypothetical protein D3C75_1261970 [compost metagenome]
MAAVVPVDKLLLGEREIMRFVMRQSGSVRPQDVSDYFSIDAKTARQILYKLCEKGWLNPVKRGEGIRKVRYELARNVLSYWD